MTRLITISNVFFKRLFYSLLIETLLHVGVFGFVFLFVGALLPVVLMYVRHTLLNKLSGATAPLEMCAVRYFVRRGGHSVVCLAGVTLFVDKTTIIRLLYVNRSA